MSKFISKFILTLFVINACNCENQPGAVTLTPQEQEYAEEYFNFTLGVDEVQGSFEDSNAGRLNLHQGATAESSFGAGHVLAVVKENLVPTSVPGYEGVLNSARNLPEAYSQLLGKILGSDLSISNTIFTPDSLPDAPSLKMIKAEVKKVDLKSSDAATQINSDVSAKTENSVPYKYIPEKSTLPPSTKAVLISTVHLSSAWSSPLAKVGSASFNGGEAVDMYEIKGAFPYLESEDALQVTIPFKNAARALILVLPTDISAVLRGGVLAEPHNGTAASVRVQFPLFNYTVRVPHKVAKSQSTCGGFEKKDNFFHLLDDVVHISATVDKFEAVSITGGMINNVAEYKKEVSSVPNAPSADSIPSATPDKIPSGGKQRSEPSDPNEKLIVLDRSFQWRVDDMIMGPIFFGTVESISKPLGDNNDLTTPNVFGLDDVPYVNCL